MRAGSPAAFGRPLVISLVSRAAPVVYCQSTKNWSVLESFAQAISPLRRKQYCLWRFQVDGFGVSAPSVSLALQPTTTVRLSISWLALKREGNVSCCSFRNRTWWAATYFKWCVQSLPARTSLYARARTSLPR